MCTYVYDHVPCAHPHTPALVFALEIDLIYERMQSSELGSCESRAIAQYNRGFFCATQNRANDRKRIAAIPCRKHDALHIATDCSSEMCKHCAWCHRRSVNLLDGENHALLREL